MNFKNIRIEKNITQNSLAEILNVRQTTISAWEVGKNLPKLSDLPRIASALNVSVEEVLYCFIEK